VTPTFKAALAEMLDVTLDAADRAHLKRWARNRRAEDIWQKFKANEKNLPRLTTKSRYPEMEFLIWRIIGARRSAEEMTSLAYQVREKKRDRERRAYYLELAQCAESLVRYFKDRPVPPDSIGLLRPSQDWKSYQRDAEMFRRFAEPSPTRRVQTVHEHVIFLRLVNEFIDLSCERPLDDVAKTLTEIAFPGQTITLDMVRSARKPTTRKARSGKR
jgi:hypothetical protein